ncbi:MAG TPA: mannose-1-phosphate guanylyltransferase/mannose-6-phosphate isomerase [Allosphingosinicella sp.]|nr:mannose-1-phosphate guanylyltransferase/mannose-6-phosphate isomerase [Allosphingosinicella sp.]
MTETADRRVIPVILSGGAGTRLWPLSVADRPKQFLALAGDESLLRQTARRVRDPARFGAPTIVASRGHGIAILGQLGEEGVAAAELILEPCARNTAAAIALAAVGSDEDDLLLVLPSDHAIADEAAFHAAIEAALPLAREDWLITFGIAPDRPETGYGYIRRGEPLARGVFRADRFVEKPDRATAEEYLAAGGYDWNAGIFLFRTAAFLQALEEYEPAILAAAREALEKGSREDGCVLPDEAAFARSPSLPVDVAVMERSSRVAVAPCDMGWSDLGSWDALHQLGPSDSAGNVLGGDTIAVDSKNCLIRSDGPTIVTVGVSDLIVVASGDAVLVVPRGQSQRVREALDALAGRGQKDAESES